MKLTIILMTVVFVHVSASSYGQRVTYENENATLKEIFTQIKKQTGYDVLCDIETIESAKPMDISFKNATLGSVLEQSFADLNLTYTIDAKTIVVKSATKKVFNPLSTIIQQTVKGTVKDKAGVTLGGVTVQSKSRRGVGVSTDLNGSYSLTVPANAVLVFTYIGFKTLEVPVNGREVVDVVLDEEESELEQVVVVGYGTQKKETVTGAISSIQTKEIKQSPAANLAVTLAGRLPGLTSIQNAGEPGREGIGLYLRGLRTLNGQSPLIMVDGVPRELTYIDPNEVESVTILKDASSTAVFGVRGANGVILVTTRRGTSEKPQISFSLENAIQQFNRIPTPVGAVDYAELSNQARQNDGRSILFSDEAIHHFRNKDRPDIYPDNDWMKMFVNNTTPQKRINLNVSGKTNFTGYFVNVGYLDQGGIWKVTQDDYDASSSMKRFNFRSNIDLKLNKNLKAFLNVAGYLEMLNKPNPDAENLNLLYYIYTYPSILPGPLTPDGEVLGVIASDSNPPFGIINRSGYRQEKRTNVTATYGMEHSLDFLTKGLSAKALASFDTRTIYNLDARQTFQQWVMDIVVDDDGVEQPVYSRRDQSENTPLSLSSSSNFLSYFNLQASVNYNRVFDDHSVTGLLLYQQDEQIRQGQRLPFRVLGAASRLTYGYKQKYFLELNAGLNGSEQFSRENRYGFFPSYSGSWIISREKFLENSNILTLLKLRTSFGKVGNDQIGDRRFLYLDDVSLGGGGYNASLYDGMMINETLVGNPDLKWEITKKTNIGLEIGLFNQFDLILDAFKEKTDNMLINRQQVSLITGIRGVPPLNIGKVENQGFELELRYRKNFNKDFSVFASTNFNYAKNKLIYNDEPIRPDTYAYRYQQQGYPIGQQFGYRADGFWRDQAEIDNSNLVYSVGAGQPRPGDLKLMDLNGDGIINEEDFAPIKYSNVPQYTFGGSLSVNYESFDVSVLFQGVSKVSRAYTGNGIIEIAQGNNVFFNIHRKAWTSERAASGEEITWPALGSSINTNHTTNEFFIWDASYLRLKNFEIGYTLSPNLASKLKVQNLRIYSNALNPFTWDKLPTKEYDPELSWVLAYPIQRVFNFGINVIF